ncbi:MAG: zinc ribbon domain-containing protein [Candidatus Bathycorpusculaceae bacterium]
MLHNEASPNRRLCESCGAILPDGAKKCQKCGAKVDVEVKYIARPTIVTENFIAQQVWAREGLPKYIVYHFNSEKFEEVYKIDLGERDAKDRLINYMPVDNDALHKGLVIVPRQVKETSWNELFEEADQFGLMCYDPCGKEAIFKLLLRVSVGSWFLDRFVAEPMFDIAGAGKFAPIIPIRGPSQSGKNRLAFVLRLLSYRPYFEMSTYRIPSIYRPLDLWQGSLVLDEADMANTSERSEFIHFLNCRATGTPISRQDPQNPKRTHVFNNFGLTILTQRKQFDDNATESRCIPFYSEVAEKQLPTVETDEMLKWGLELQDKLLYLRMKFFREVIIDKSTWLGGISDPRLNASLLPLIALSKFDASVYETIAQTARDIERLKIEEKSTSEDGLVVNYLWEKIEGGLWELWNNPAYYVLQEHKVVRGEQEVEREIKIPLTTSILAEHFKWTANRSRKVIRGLNLAKQGLPTFVKVGGKAYRVIFFEPLKLEKRLREFVVDYVPKKLFEVLGVTEVTDVTLPLHGASPEKRGGEAEPTVEKNCDFRDICDPDFLWRPIPEAERCEMCGKEPVSVEINDVKGRQILRRCRLCFEKMQTRFSKAVWRRVG